MDCTFIGEMVRDFLETEDASVLDGCGWDRFAGNRSLVGRISFCKSGNIDSNQLKRGLSVSSTFFVSNH